MKKILVSLGMIGMLAATPAFAATAKQKPAPHRHLTHTTVCMVKGKRTACPDHIVLKRHHHTHTAKK